MDHDKSTWKIGKINENHYWLSYIKFEHRYDYYRYIVSFFMQNLYQVHANMIIIRIFLLLFNILFYIISYNNYGVGM